MGVEYFVFDFVVYRRLEEKIPKPKRVASFNVRKLNQFIPTSIIILTVLLFLSSVGIEFYKLLQTEEIAKFWMKKIPFTLSILVLIPSFWYSFQRTPICDDLEIDNLYRKMELNLINLLFVFFAIDNILGFLLKMAGVPKESLGGFAPLSAIVPLSLYFIFLLYVKRINSKVAERYKLAFQH